jgi:hypothetical protein
MPALGSCADRQRCTSAAAHGACAESHRYGPAAYLLRPCASYTARRAVSAWQPTANRVACAVFYAQLAWVDVPESGVPCCLDAIASSCTVSSAAGFVGVIVDFCFFCRSCTVTDYLVTCSSASCAASSYAQQKWGGSSQETH